MRALLSILATLLLVSVRAEENKLPADFPYWVLGLARTQDRALELHFIYGEVAYFYQNKDYEELAWRHDGNKVWVIRKDAGKEVRVGYVVRAPLEGYLEWHPSRTGERTRILKQWTRDDPP